MQYGVVYSRGGIRRSMQYGKVCRSGGRTRKRGTGAAGLMHNHLMQCPLPKALLPKVLLYFLTKIYGSWRIRFKTTQSICLQEPEAQKETLPCQKVQWNLVQFPETYFSAMQWRIQSKCFRISFVLWFQSGVELSGGCRGSQFSWLICFTFDSNFFELKFLAVEVFHFWF